MTFQQILALAGKLGYSGDKTNETQVRSFVLSKMNDDDTFTIAGKRTAATFGKDKTPITRAALEASGDGGVATLEIDEEPKPADDATKRDATPKTPIDIASEIKTMATALVEVEMRKIATGLSGRLTLQGEGGGKDGDAGRNPDVKVRGMDEVVYDAWHDAQKAKGNRPTIRSFEQAKTMHAHMVQCLVPHLDKCSSPSQRDALQRGGQWSSKWYVSRGLAKESDIDRRTYATSPNGSGGAYTGTQFSQDLIKNVNLWGPALRYPRLVVMTEKTTDVPKVTGDITVNYPDENATSTSQKATPTNIQMTAHTGVMATKASLQITADSRIDIAAQIVDDFTRSMARHKERMLFIGDGTATYAGVKGLVTRLSDIGFGTAKGLVLGGGNMLAHTDANLRTLMGYLPDYARPGACWFCHPSAVAWIFDNVGSGKSGVLWKEVQDYGYVMTYAGYPIITSNAMNGTESTGTNSVDVIFGDLDRAVLNGSRLEMEITMDTSVGFLDYAAWWRCVDRHDMVVHEPGDSSNAGAYVALYQN